jgi:hypothetical protein
MVWSKYAVILLVFAPEEIHHSTIATTSANTQMIEIVLARFCPALVAKVVIAGTPPG